MKRTLVVSLLSGLVGFGLAYLVQWFQASPPTTVMRLSPDETLRARLVEVSPGWGLDRDFEIRLEDLVKGTSRVLFHSPDEGKPAGTERLIWSKDGNWLLLVGRHCFVKDDLFLDNGDQLYFLYHLKTDRSWCNSLQRSSYPPIRAETIEGIEFTEPIRLKAR